MAAKNVVSYFMFHVTVADPETSERGAKKHEI